MIHNIIILTILFIQQFEALQISVEQRHPLPLPLMGLLL